MLFTVTNARALAIAASCCTCCFNAATGLDEGEAPKLLRDIAGMIIVVGSYERGYGVSCYRPPRKFNQWSLVSRRIS